MKLSDLFENIVSSLFSKSELTITSAGKFMSKISYHCLEDFDKEMLNSVMAQTVFDDQRNVWRHCYPDALYFLFIDTRYIVCKM